MKWINLVITVVILSAVPMMTESCHRDIRPDRSVEDSLLLAVGNYLDWEGENGFSGVVLVKMPGSEPLVRNYGFASLEMEIPNGPDVVYGIGALTKQFTAAAVLKLQMMGKLSVQDPLGHFLPDLSPGLQQVTLHRLLTHSSGLPEEIGSRMEALTREEFLNRIRQLPDQDYSDTTFHYSHVGFNLLGLVIEKAAGMDYEKFLQRYLFKPAGMKRTGFRIPDWSRCILAHGYDFCDDWGRPMDSGWLDDGPSWNRRASGGLLSTANDLYLWHLALLGDDILDESSKRQYYYPDPGVPINRESSAAYGWRVIKSNRGTDVIAHSGWSGMFFSDFMRYLKEDVTIILLSNQFRGGNQNMPYQIARIVFKYPDPPKLWGRKTVCYDSLPSDRLGQVAGRFFAAMAGTSDAELKKLINTDIASHLMNKYGQDSLLTSFRQMQEELGACTYKQVRVYDHRILFIDVIRRSDSHLIPVKIFLDENEEYRIRGISY